MLRLMRRPTRVLCAVLAPNPGEPTAEVRLGIRGIFVGLSLGKEESQTRSMLADPAKVANSPSLRRRRGRPCHLQDSPRRLCCLRHLSKRSMLSRRPSRLRAGRAALWARRDVTRRHPSRPHGLARRPWALDSTSYCLLVPPGRSRGTPQGSPTTLLVSSPTPGDFSSSARLAVTKASRSPRATRCGTSGGG